MQRLHVFITGIPRSGTTWITSLFDTVPNCVALNEPVSHGRWPKQNPTASVTDYVQYLATDCRRIRNSILDELVVEDLRAPSGEATTDYHRGAVKPAVRRIDLSNRALQQDFTLCIKHNAPYLAVLEHLVELEDADVFAVVRNPFDVLWSWRNLNLPVSVGKLPHGVAYWPEMRAITESQTELLHKQVLMYDAMCERIVSFRNKLSVIRYEEVGSHPERLRDLLGLAIIPIPQIRVGTLPTEFVKEVGSLLRKSPGAHKEFGY